MEKNHMLLVWKTQSSNLRVASTRIRCLLPMLLLERIGYTSVILQKNENIENYKDCKALIFVKSFSKHDYDLAVNASKNNVTIILDLCDNIFVENYPEANSSYFNLIANLAASIVTTNEKLAYLIKVKTSHKKIIVIPDQAEELNNIQEIIRKEKIWAKRKFLVTKNPLITSLKNKLNLIKDYKWYVKIAYALFRRLRSYFIFSGNYIFNFFIEPQIFGVTNVELKRIIWYGNHGASYSNFGMKSLLNIKDDLEKINKLIPIELLVVSNNREKFEDCISQFKLKTSYKNWDALSIFNDIKNSDVTVIPNMGDEFSVYKSPNRAILSLSLGTPVVASSLNLNKELCNCIYVDNFYEGILAYLTNPIKVASDQKKAKFIIKNRYSSIQVERLWSALLESLILPVNLEF